MIHYIFIRNVLILYTFVLNFMILKHKQFIKMYKIKHLKHTIAYISLATPFI